MKRIRTKIYYWCNKCEKITSADYELGGVVTQDEKDTVEYVNPSPYDMEYLDATLIKRLPPIKCNYCNSNKTLAYIDPLMVDAIEKIHKCNIKTASCCSGHDFEDKVYIKFKPSAILTANINLFIMALQYTFTAYPEFLNCEPGIIFLKNNRKIKVIHNVDSEEPSPTSCCIDTIDKYFVVGECRVSPQTLSKYKSEIASGKKFTDIEERDMIDDAVKETNKYFCYWMGKFCQLVTCDMKEDKKVEEKKN